MPSDHVAVDGLRHRHLDRRLRGKLLLHYVLDSREPLC